MKMDGKREGVASHMFKRDRTYKHKSANDLDADRVCPGQESSSEPDLVFVERKSNKLNVRMFNFEKVITDIETFRYLSSGKKKYSASAQLSKQKQATSYRGGKFAISAAKGVTRQAYDCSNFVGPSP
jgi:predicted secreted protein